MEVFYTEYEKFPNLKIKVSEINQKYREYSDVTMMLFKTNENYFYSIFSHNGVKLTSHIPIDRERQKFIDSIKNDAFIFYENYLKTIRGKIEMRNLNLI